MQKNWLEVYKAFTDLPSNERQLVFRTLLENQKINGQTLLAWYMSYLEGQHEVDMNYLETAYKAAQTYMLAVKNEGKHITFIRKTLIEVFYLIVKKLRGKDCKWLSNFEKNEFAKVDENNLNPMAAQLLKEDPSKFLEVPQIAWEE